MSSFEVEQIRMPPITKATMQALGTELAKLLQPSLLAGEPLNLPLLVDERLQSLGIDVYPEGNKWDLPDPDVAAWTETLPDRTRIVVRQDIWDAFVEPPPRSHFARATLAHELGHALLHSPVIRRRRKANATELLARRSTTSMLTIEQPEWQAWCLAGCLAMPEAAVDRMPVRNEFTLSSQFAVSVDFARQHLARYPRLRGGHRGA